MLSPLERESAHNLSHILCSAILKVHESIAIPLLNCPTRHLHWSSLTPDSNNEKKKNIAFSTPVLKMCARNRWGSDSGKSCLNRKVWETCEEYVLPMQSACIRS